MDCRKFKELLLHLGTKVFSLRVKSRLYNAFVKITMMLGNGT